MSPIVDHDVTFGFSHSCLTSLKKSQQFYHPARTQVQGFYFVLLLVSTDRSKGRTRPEKPQ